MNKSRLSLFLLSLGLCAQTARAESLAELKPDVYRAALQLQKDILHQQEEAQSWAKMAEQEADPRMKGVNAAFADGFASSARNLDAALRLVADLGHLGEDLEKTAKLLADKPSCEMLLLVRHEILFAGKKLVIVKKTLKGHVSALKEFDRGAKKLLADMGDPSEKIKKWEKETVKVALEHNALEGHRLSDVASLSARMAQVLVDMSQAAKAAGASCPG